MGKESKTSEQMLLSLGGNEENRKELLLKFIKSFEMENTRWQTGPTVNELH